MSKSAIIIGAGIGGLTAAHALRQMGWKTQTFERANAFSEVGAGIQLSPNATRILSRLNLLDSVKANSFEPEAATIRDGKTGSALMYAPLKGYCQRYYGGPYLHVYRPMLQSVLAKGVDVQLGCDIASYDPTQLTVAADGFRSALRAQMNGPSDPEFRGQVAWRGVVTADSRLKALIPEEACVWVGPEKHLVTYYIGPELINFVAVTEQDQWLEEGWNTPGDLNELRDHFSNWHPKLGEILDACTSVQRWGLFDRPALARWVDGKTALLGDAAHPTLPFLAQGAALAIEDAWALAGNASDLTKYEKIRKPRATRLQSWARANAKLYHKSRLIDRLKLLVSRRIFRGPQALLLFWSIFSG
ncbi:MAG: FAD-dependent monooxygenase [Alphaproteobacteria bacterium]